MSGIPPAQRYAKAAAQALRDSKRPLHEVPVLNLGEATLRETRALMGLSLQALSDSLLEVSNLRWSKSTLAKVEDSTRAMTIELERAINQLIELRKKRR